MTNSQPYKTSLMKFLVCVALLMIGSCGLSMAAGWDRLEVDLVSGNLQQLLDRKSQIQQGDPKALSDFRSLIKKADQSLTQGLLSVTQKRRVPPSGDKHDYLSLAPYWWPDPKKQDGLPWIRRDGRVNPQTRGDHVDYGTKQQLFQRVETLGLAAFYSEDKRYAEKAVALLEAWFVDPKTRMNPNLEYAQGVPGRSDGRCFGIIEWCGIRQLIVPIQLLHAGGAIPESTYESLVAWFEAYLQWLQTSKKGTLERDTRNNHATWYDVQVTEILLFLDRPEEAREILERVKTKRIATQIESDGRQPHELARTKSLSYSRMNLNAFIRLANLGKKVGVDLWNYQTPDGRSIRKAQAFLDQFGQGKKKWPYQQLGQEK